MSPSKELLAQRAAHYSPEQWRRILSAYVSYEFDDPLYLDARAYFVNEKDGEMLPEDGFLQGAVVALGQREYRRALLPLAEQMGAYIEGLHRSGDYAHDIEAFCVALLNFSTWCIGDDDSVDAILRAKLIDRFGHGDGEAIKGDPISDVFFSCMWALLHVYADMVQYPETRVMFEDGLGVKIDESSKRQ